MDVLLNPDRQAHLKLYVQGVLRRFSKDPRVLAWDIWNEPDNVDGGQRDTPREPHNKAELVLPLLKEAFVWARGVNPTQPLTSAVWRHPHDVDTQDPVKRFQLEQSDIISFHCYGPTPYFQQTARALQSLGRPLICTEYMARENGGAFDPLLGWMRDQKIGAYCWDFVNGRTQTIYPVRSWRQPFTNEPAIWNTCLLRADGSSYRQNETDYIHAVMTRRD